MGLQKCGLNLNRDNKELQPHGTPDFPCAGYSSSYTDSTGDVIPWHWHQELEILFLESGSLRLQLPEKVFHLTQGDVFIINSNILHFAAAEPLCMLKSIVFSPLMVTGGDGFIFAEKYITPLINCSAFDGLFLSSDSREGEQFKSLFAAAFQALSSDLPGYEFTVRENLSKICFSLCQIFPCEAETSSLLDPDSRRIRRMLDYIHCHYSEPLKLQQIAEAADIGERECLRCFRRMIQISPVQYLLKYRITQGALMLLHNPEKSISDIAGECGFDSPGNFSQLFKRYYRCTPKEYRKQ